MVFLNRSGSGSEHHRERGSRLPGVPIDMVRRLHASRFQTCAYAENATQNNGLILSAPHSINDKIGDYKDSTTKGWIKDTLGLGTGLWLFGYLVSLLLFFTPFVGIMGWIITAVFTPVTIAITWWWFRARNLTLTYYAGVGIAWAVIAVVLDYLFIVQLFQAAYYPPDVFLYYALTFLIPLGVGLYLTKTREKPQGKQR